MTKTVKVRRHKRRATNWVVTAYVVEKGWRDILTQYPGFKSRKRAIEVKKKWQKDMRESLPQYKLFKDIRVEAARKFGWAVKGGF